MTSFLFIVSFLLHIVSLTAIYALSKQVSTNKSTDSSDIINLMESYLEEIREENIRLQQELAKSNKIAKETPIVRGESSRPSVNDELPDITQTLLQNEQVQDDIEVSLQSRILKLYEDGLETEEIARKLGCGKTEVDLIIKFREKSNI